MVTEDELTVETGKKCRPLLLCRGLGEGAGTGEGVGDCCVLFFLERGWGGCGGGCGVGREGAGRRRRWWKGLLGSIGGGWSWGGGGYLCVRIWIESYRWCVLVVA